MIRTSFKLKVERARSMFTRNFTSVVSRRIFLRKHNPSNRQLCTRQSENHFRIFGIETSCDDTGCAVVDNEGKLLGEALSNQAQFHLENGGIIPAAAARMHRENMVLVADQALDAAGISMADIDAVAATVKPGMAQCLEVGTMYGCHLSRLWRKPFIPIHHMEAHALTARMFDKEVQFPFLALLISGGHCLLVLVQNADLYLLLGKTLDCSPGELFDKAYRRMKLRNIPALRKMCGGQAVETMATKASNPTEFEFSIPLIQYPNCDFSFSGMRTYVENLILSEEQKYGTGADEIIESASNLCASMQLAIARKVCRKVERAMAFVESMNMIPGNRKSLVVSGGVACNQFLARAFKLICDTHDYHLSIPPPKYCNDNGVMIAWNGVERFRENKGILQWDQLDDVKIQPKCPLGTDIRDQVEARAVKPQVVVRKKSLIELL